MLELSIGQHICRSLVVLLWSFVTVCACLSKVSISDKFLMTQLNTYTVMSA